MIAVITAALSIISLLVEAWFAATPQRQKESRDEATQRGRDDIASGNAAAVSVRIDGLLADQAGTSGNPPGIGNGQAGESDASTLARLAALGCGTGEVTGESGAMQAIIPPGVAQSLVSIIQESLAEPTLPLN
jgi:hypothetical protein